MLVPGHRAGLGVTVSAVAVGLAARAAGRLDRVPGTLAVVLCLTAALRDGGWVVATSLVGAAALGSLAATGGRTWAAVTRGLVAAPIAAPAGAGAVARGLGALVPRGRLGDVRPAARGVAVAVVLGGLFGGLFVSADPAFAQIAHD